VLRRVVRDADELVSEWDPWIPALQEWLEPSVWCAQIDLPDLRVSACPGYTRRVTTQAEVEARLERLERNVRDLVRECEELPREVLYREPRAGEWTVINTLAHVAEILPYWAHQAEAILRSPGAPFGRTHEDPDRIAAVEQHAADTLAEVLERVRRGLDESLSTLRSIPAAEWGKAGVHSRRGSMTITDVVDSFLCSHAEEHLRQIRETLGALATAR
jgi:uncharacterized damage-inducible protein DinB